MGEGVEDGDEAVDGVEREGGNGGDVAGGEEGGLEEEEEGEGGAEVGEGEGAVEGARDGGCEGLWLLEGCGGCRGRVGPVAIW